jgi:hypothetical protein
VSLTKNLILQALEGGVSLPPSGTQFDGPTFFLKSVLTTGSNGIQPGLKSLACRRRACAASNCKDGQASADETKDYPWATRFRIRSIGLVVIASANREIGSAN